MSQVHVCLLSGQLLPNLIPILMERPRPLRVYLVTTEEMAQEARHKRMQRLLRREGIEVCIRPGAPSTGFTGIRGFAGKLADQLRAAEPGRTIVLNATGGTKLLSMGFVEVFRERLEGYPLRVIYTDTGHQVIETLVPRGQEATPMLGVLRADSYLAAQGMTLASSESDREAWRSAARARRSLTEHLAENTERLVDFFSVVNGLVHGGPERPGALSPGGPKAQRFPSQPRGHWKDALTRIADAGLVGWQGAETIHFESVEAARYLSGGWLEEYAWLTACAADLQDVRCSVTGRWEQQSGPTAPINELDLLVVHDNRLLIVECKTGRQATSEQAVATRLESLGRNAGGLFGSSLLLSARELSSTMQSRCRNLGIRVLAQRAIADLADHLGRWRDTGTLPSS